MPLPLNLENIGGDENQIISLSPSLQTSLDLFLSALETERGLALDCGTVSQAIAKRFSLYRDRRKLVDAGHTGIADLTIKVDGPEVHILPPVNFTVRKL